MSNPHEGAALQKQAQAQINPNDKLTQLVKSMNAYKDVVAQVAPKNGIGVERILAISAFIVKSNPKLAACSAPSIISAVMMAAMSGLDPNPAAGQVYFVPYGGEVQMQYGYKGEVNLAYRTGVIESIYARAVYAGDEFDHRMGSDESITHKAGPNHGDSSMVTHAYCVAYLKGAKRPVIECLNKAQIERLRKKNQAQYSAKWNPSAEPKEAWKTDYDMMARKSATRRLVEKELPTSVEWNEIASWDGAISPKLEDFNRDGSGVMTMPDYPQEPAVETKGEVVE